MDVGTRHRGQALSPGQYAEMVAEVNRALYRFMPGRNGDPKAGLAYTLITLINEAAMTLDRESTGENEPRDPHFWTVIGEGIGARRVIHSVYYTLVDTHVIKPGREDQEKT